jgi:mannose-6-phosphate isomerase-like protein (cupin superfamily)
MKKFNADKDGWYCGFWNNSPLAISFALRKELYKHEKLHYHKDFYEYYLVIDGEMILIVNKKELLLKKYDLLMIEPREIHRVINVCHSGCAYVNIKQKSHKNGTISVKK